MFAADIFPSQFEPISRLPLAGTGGGAVFYGFITGLSQRIAVPQAGGSWLLVTTLANVGVTLLVKVLLLGWIALTDSAESALGGL